jgi:LysM repeat protein
VAIERIVRANPGKLSSTRSMLRIGERLNIPPAGAQVTMPSMMAVTNSSGSSSPTATSTAGRYTVKAGDTLYQIAIRTMGAATRRNIAAIKTANGISNDRDLRVGEVLKIP